MSEVLVIGAGIGSLVAATYLAKAGVDVTLLEASAVAGGKAANTLAVDGFAAAHGDYLMAALDPVVLKDLQLTHLGLSYAVRDVPTIAVLPDQRLTLTRDAHTVQRSLAHLSAKDGDRYRAFRRAHLGFARAMRNVWWDEGTLDSETRSALRAMALTASVPWLDGQFESEALKMAFGFDALAAGTSPSAAGSALLLAWQASQEMCGLQGARALLRGGPAALVDVLLTAAEAAGVRLRRNTEVAHLALDGEAVRGAVLSSGEMVEGRTIVSGLSRRKTLLEFLPPGVVGFASARRLGEHPHVGEAKVVLSLKAPPPAFGEPARYLVGESLSAAVTAYGEARSGVLPSDLFLEVVVPETAIDGSVLMVVAVRPVPVSPPEGWPAMTASLVHAVLKTLEHIQPGLTASVTGLGFVPPHRGDAFHLAEMAAPWASRITTPVRGLFLCGASAEPVPCLSGRAGRIAAAMVLDQQRGAGA